MVNKTSERIFAEEEKWLKEFIEKLHYTLKEDILFLEQCVKWIHSDCEQCIEKLKEALELIEEIKKPTTPLTVERLKELIYKYRRAWRRLKLMLYNAAPLEKRGKELHETISSYLSEIEEHLKTLYYTRYLIKPGLPLLSHQLSHQLILPSPLWRIVKKK